MNGAFFTFHSGAGSLNEAGNRHFLIVLMKVEEARWFLCCCVPLWAAFSVCFYHRFHRVWSCRAGLHLTSPHCSTVWSLHPVALSLCRVWEKCNSHKTTFFYYWWTWTYDCSPVLYQSTSLSVNLLWKGVTVKHLVKVPFCLFLNEILMFSV